MPIPIDFSKLQPQDVLDIATFIEHEAQQRYDLYADHLEREGDPRAAEFFRFMATLERAHGAQLGARRLKRFADLPKRVRDVVEWDVEGPPLDRRVSRLSFTTALEMAIASEERARDFFAAALEQPVGDGLQAVLAELHRDEQGHIALLRDQIATLKTPR